METKFAIFIFAIFILSPFVSTLPIRNGNVPEPPRFLQSHLQSPPVSTLPIRNGNGLVVS